jgi:membrane protein required for colicin V production
MAITLLDGILIGITLISAFLAMLRGFSREVLSVGSWVVAAVVALLYYPLALPFMQQYINSEPIAVGAAIGSIFIVVLIIATIITVKIADFIIDSRVGPLDRTLGFIFGAIRGLLIVVIGTMFLNWILQSQPPDWVANAKSKPLLDNIGERLRQILPEDGGAEIMERIQGGDDETEGQQDTTPTTNG